MVLAADRGATMTANIKDNGTSRPVDRAHLPLAGIAILVVEDDADARRRASRSLEAWGAIVVSVGSAEDALKVFQSIIPAIVLTDLGLPRRDGTWLLRQIRRLAGDKGGRVPVIAFSAYVQPRERELIRAAGFHDLIGKPLDPFELCSVVARALS
jgi:CheY-like chemotaxis protein